MKNFKFYKLGNTPYTVTSGDSVSKIAMRYGTTTNAVIEANKGKYPSLITNPNRIEIGWTFIIPVAQTVTPTNPTLPPQPKQPQPEQAGFFSEFQKAFGTTGLLIGGLMVAGIVIVSTKPKRR